jgi:MarR family 2-MHQ and catechol resistance regulon transcriptional repressor
MTSAKRATSKITRSDASGAGAADLPTATALKLWVVLSRSHEALVQVLKADVERHDLTLAEFAVMDALHNKGPLLLGDLQKRVLVSSGGMTFLVDRLAKRGLAERQACPSDRRARYAALTRKGERLMRSIFPEHAAIIHGAMAGLRQSEQRELTALLKSLGKEAARLAAETPACREARAAREPE